MPKSSLWWFATESHHFFCFYACDWDQMGPTASTDAPTTGLASISQSDFVPKKPQCSSHASIPPQESRQLTDLEVDVEPHAVVPDLQHLVTGSHQVFPILGCHQAAAARAVNIADLKTNKTAMCCILCVRACLFVSKHMGWFFCWCFYRRKQAALSQIQFISLKSQCALHFDDSPLLPPPHPPNHITTAQF